MMVFVSLCLRAPTHRHTHWHAKWIHLWRLAMHKVSLIHSSLLGLTQTIKILTTVKKKKLWIELACSFMRMRHVRFQWPYLSSLGRVDSIWSMSSLWNVKFLSTKEELLEKSICCTVMWTSVLISRGADSQLVLAKLLPSTWQALNNNGMKGYQQQVGVWRCTAVKGQRIMKVCFLLTSGYVGRCRRRKRPCSAKTHPV